MEPCPRCNGFAERINLRTPNEYQDLARQLIEIVAQGTFLMVHADCSLEEILEPTFPGDYFAHDFQCTTCGRAFHLGADTYHGNVNWIPVD